MNGIPNRHQSGRKTSGRYHRKMAAGKPRQKNTFKVSSLPKLSDFRIQVQSAIERAKHPKQHVAVLFMSLEPFGIVQSSIRDQDDEAVLEAITEKLDLALKEDSLVSFIGLDQIIILLARANNLDEIVDTAKCLIDQFTHPLRVADGLIRTAASIGIAMTPFDGDHATHLIRHSSAAMMFAQKDGGNRFHFCTKYMSETIDERFMLSADIKPAISRDEFVMVYQPQIDTLTGVVTGMEALVRWNHPKLGVIKPDRFISIAETSDAIIKLGEWIFNASLQKMRQWMEAGFHPKKIAINVSARQMHDPHFVDTVIQALSANGVPAQNLEIELTESALITDMRSTIKAMEALVSHGVIFAIDDFGTGYASLEYLRQLPVKAVKIDQSFIQNIATGARDANLARALIAMISELGLKTIAEGVENKDQLQSLQKTACNVIQGFLFSGPLTASDATQLLGLNPSYAV